MAMHVVDGAMLQCSMGVGLSRFVVLPTRKDWSTTPAATVDDHVSMMNILPFGLCHSPLNPAVATATTAAAGVLTPQACVPCTNTRWVPGVPNNQIAGSNVLNSSSLLLCQWGGAITVAQPGQTTASVP